MKKWECSVCGYIHIGDEPPDECPVCGADKSQFVLLTEDLDSDTFSPQATNNSETSENPKPLSGFSFADKLSQRLSHPRLEYASKLLSRYHAHPMAVHIPNGVLPLSLLFTLLAIAFQSPGFAVAARINFFFVFLSMPIVIATGLVDWVLLFHAKMTQVFKTKIICAGIVTALSGIVSIWWFVQPEIHLHGSSKTVVFILLCLINFCAAAIAGWNGGKLVFRNTSIHPRKKFK